MTSFKKSFVYISEEFDCVSLPLSTEVSTEDDLALFLGDATMIEEITIIVRAEMEAAPPPSKNKEALAALDPLSQHLWLQALQLLH